METCTCRKCVVCARAALARSRARRVQTPSAPKPPPPRPAAPAPKPARVSLPVRGECFHLGKVTDRLGCNCPRKWVRACALHGTCTPARCQACPDWEAV